MPQQRILIGACVSKRTLQSLFNKGARALVDQLKHRHGVGNRLAADQHQNLVNLARRNSNVSCMRRRFHKSSVPCLGKRGRFFLYAQRVTFKKSRGSHLAKAMSDHFFGDKNRQKLSAL